MPVELSVESLKGPTDGGPAGIRRPGPLEHGPATRSEAADSQPGDGAGNSRHGDGAADVRPAG